MDHTPSINDAFATAFARERAEAHQTKETAQQTEEQSDSVEKVLSLGPVVVVVTGVLLTGARIIVL